MECLVLSAVSHFLANSSRKVEKHKDAWIFAKKVDAKKLGIPDYYVIIKRPMDFKIIKTNLKTVYRCARLTASPTAFFQTAFQSVVISKVKGFVTDSQTEVE